MRFIRAVNSKNRYKRNAVFVFFNNLIYDFSKFFNTVAVLHKVEVDCSVDNSNSVSNSFHEREIQKIEYVFFCACASMCVRFDFRKKRVFRSAFCRWKVRDVESCPWNIRRIAHAYIKVVVSINFRKSNEICYRSHSPASSFQRLFDADICFFFAESAMNEELYPFTIICLSSLSVKLSFVYRVQYSSRSVTLK